MSYASNIGGAPALVSGGFGYFGLAGEFPIREPDAGMRDLQQELQRLGYLQAGGGIYGADGEFGPRTASALRAAAAYVGWSGGAYSPTNAAERRSGTVTVPDDLIERIRAARPNPDAPYATEAPPDMNTAVEPKPDSTTIGPHLDDKTLRQQASSDSGSWLGPLLIGGGVLAVGGVIAYTMSQKKKAPKKNRRRRRR